MIEPFGSLGSDKPLSEPAKTGFAKRVTVQELKEKQWDSRLKVKLLGGGCSREGVWGNKVDAVTHKIAWNSRVLPGCCRGTTELLVGWTPPWSFFSAFAFSKVQPLLFKQTA